jgi:hypothetical protein
MWRDCDWTRSNLIALTWGFDPHPGSVARKGTPAPRAAPSRARCARRGSAASENKILGAGRITDLIRSRSSAAPFTPRNDFRAPSSIKRIFLLALNDSLD